MDVHPNYFVGVSPDAPRLRFLASQTRAEWEETLLNRLKKDRQDGTGTEEWGQHASEWERKRARLTRIHEGNSGQDVTLELGEAIAMTGWFRLGGDWADEPDLTKYRLYDPPILRPLDPLDFTNSGDENSDAESVQGFEREASVDENLHEDMYDSDDGGGEGAQRFDSEGARSLQEGDFDEAMRLANGGADLVVDEDDDMVIAPAKPDVPVLPTPDSSHTPPAANASGDADIEREVVSPARSAQSRTASAELVDPEEEVPAAVTKKRGRASPPARDGPPPRKLKMYGPKKEPAVKKHVKKAKPPIAKPRERIRPKGRPSKLVKGAEEVEELSHLPLKDAFVKLGMDPPNPDNTRSRGEFDLYEASYRTEVGEDPLCFLRLSKWSPSRMLNDDEIRGFVGRREDVEEELLGEGERPENERTTDPKDGQVEVIIKAKEIQELAPTLDGVILFTKHARIRLRTFAPGEDTFGVKLLAGLYAFGREANVRGQTGHGVDGTINSLNMALDDPASSTSWLERLCSNLPEYRLPSPLETYSIDDLPSIPLILYHHLINTAFLTPFASDLASPFLLPGMARTDPSHDLVKAQSTQEADEALLRGVLVEATEEDHSKCQPDRKSLVGSRTHPVEVELARDSFQRRAGLKNVAAQKDRQVDVFKSAFVNGKRVSAGDSVLIIGRMISQTGNHLGIEYQLDDPDQMVAEPWFGKIRYFWDDPDKRSQGLQAHVGWYRHLRDTRIGTVAGHARHLINDDQCDSIDAHTILRKIEVKDIGDDGRIPSTGFYSGFTWDHDSNAFLDSRPLEDTEKVGNALCREDGLEPCVSCERRAFEAKRLEDKPTPKKLAWNETRKDKDKEKEKERSPRPVWVATKPGRAQSFDFAGVTYHVGDYVYLVPPHNDTKSEIRRAFLLARLVGVAPQTSAQFTGKSSITVEYLFRRDEIFDSGTTDERRLLTSNVKGVVELERLQGTFRLQHRDTVMEGFKKGRLTLADQHCALKLFTDQQDHFYTNEHFQPTAAEFGDFWYLKDGDPIDRPEEGKPPRETRLKAAQAKAPLVTQIEVEDVVPCPQCEKAAAVILAKEAEARKLSREESSTTLNGLSLYSGIDLFGYGLSATNPFLSFKTAVELDETVAEAFALNHPYTNLVNAPVSDFIEQAYMGDTHPDEPFELDGKPFITPAKDNVHFVCAGCPCQGFSSCNQFKREDDVRCVEPWVFLSVLDFYRPLFACFENVRAIQEFSLPLNSEKGDLLHVLEDGLLRLGYQFRTAIYQSAAYGTPQSRRRIIITIAQRGLPLPASPQPTHAYTDELTTMFSQFFDARSESYRAQPSTRPHGHAPHPPTTVSAAIADLPPFGFLDPFATPSPEKLKNASLMTWEPQRPLGFADEDKASYETEPMSSFQRSVRINTKGSKPGTQVVVFDHTVPSCSEKRAAQFSHIKLAEYGKKGGNYKDIPKTVPVRYKGGIIEDTPLRPDIPPKIEEEKLWQFWRRLRWGELLTPLRTTINPDGTSHGSRIHPEQVRQISLREAARFQGCPDFIRFKGSDDAKMNDYLLISVRRAAQLKAVGNAVPVPLAAAFGREFFKSASTLLLEDVESIDIDENFWTMLKAKRSVSSRKKGKQRARLSSEKEQTPPLIELDSDSEEEEEVDEQLFKPMSQPSSSARRTNVPAALPMDVDDDEESSDDEDEMMIVVPSSTSSTRRPLTGPTPMRKSAAMTMRMDVDDSSDDEVEVIAMCSSSGSRTR